MGRCWKMVLAAMILVSVACSTGDSRGTKDSSSSETGPILVTRDDPLAPAGCRPREVAKLVIRFLTALNHGDAQALRRFFDAGFEWFSVTGSPVKAHLKHFVAYSPEEAIEYVKAHPGFDLRLRAVDVAVYGSHGGGDIAYHGVWILPGDREGQRQFVGKGAIDCAGRIKVWSMAVPHPGDEEDFPLCPEPGGEVPVGAVLACSRERR